jgi:hypothetical protein
MQDIRHSIYTTLSSSLSLNSFSGVDNIKEYDNNDLVLADHEKLVYTNSAIAIGNIETEQNWYSHGYDVLKHKVNVFLFSKSSLSRTQIEVNFSSCSKVLRDSDLGLSNISPLISKPIFNVSITKIPNLQTLSDKIKYAEMEVEISEIVDVTN